MRPWDESVDSNPTPLQYAYNCYVGRDKKKADALATRSAHARGVRPRASSILRGFFFRAL